MATSLILLLDQFTRNLTAIRPKHGRPAGFRNRQRLLRTVWITNCIPCRAFGCIIRSITLNPSRNKTAVSASCIRLLRKCRASGTPMSKEALPAGLGIGISSRNSVDFHTAITCSDALVRTRRRRTFRHPVGPSGRPRPRKRPGFLAARSHCRQRVSARSDIVSGSRSTRAG